VSVTNIPSDGLAYVRQVLSQRLDPRARLLVEARAARWKAEPLPALLTREMRDAELGIGPTTGRVLERSGVLPSFLQSGHRLVPSDLVMKYAIDQILASFPVDGEPLKAPGAPHLRPQLKPSEPVKAVHERPADAPRLGRSRKHPELAAASTA
jgi:hypothetical protein